MVCSIPPRPSRIGTLATLMAVLAFSPTHAQAPAGAQVATPQGAAAPAAPAQNKNLWSGRFDVDPDAAVFDFGASFRFDRRLFEDDVTGSIAWSEAIEKAGVLTADDGRQIRGALDDILERGRKDPAFVSGPDEDIHSFVERQLVERIGENGKRLHTGRSRNDQVAVDMRLYVRRRARVVQASLASLVNALATQAGDAGDTVMPGYTHVRRAQPVLVAHYFLSHAAALQRDYDRFAEVAHEADAMPLGAGAIAGTNYNVDTDMMAKRLGFSRVVANSMDAVADRDFVSSFLHASALAMVHLSRLAEDIVFFSGEEFGYFEISDAVATGSSLMPQKKNPDPAELIRGKTGRVIGHLTGLLATLKGIPTGYDKDLQEDKEPLFDAEATVLGSTDSMTTIVRTMSLNKERANHAADGFLLATDVADYLVAKGMPFRTAHETVAGMVRKLMAQGREFDSLSVTEWKAFSPLFEADVKTVLTGRTSVKSKRSPQSTNPDAVAAQLRQVRDWVTRTQAAR